MVIKNMDETKIILNNPKYLWFLTLTYCMAIVLSNWFDPRLIAIFGFSTTAGTLVFPITFLLSDLITEVYGYKNSRKAIWCGFLFNVIFILYGQLIIHMPSPHYSETRNALFDSFFIADIRIIFASIISYFCSEPINSFIMSKLKIKMNGMYMGIRFIISTIAASFIDSTIFCSIAFYGSISNINLINLILTMWIIKVLIEILALPFSIKLAKKLKKIEKLDIYDKNTNFNILDLDTEYTNKDNEFITTIDIH
jgi:hypothetical protein